MDIAIDRSNKRLDKDLIKQEKEYFCGKAINKLYNRIKEANC